MIPDKLALESVVPAAVTGWWDCGKAVEPANTRESGEVAASGRYCPPLYSNQDQQPAISMARCRHTEQICKLLRCQRKYNRDRRPGNAPVES